MNKIFRVIYSQATQSWVAVSELTKAHKKQSSSSAKKSASGSSANLIKSSAIALSLLSGSAAYAAETAASGLIQINSTKGMATATGSDSIAIGKNSKATGNDGALAIGRNSTADGKNSSIALGSDSKASGESNIALGYLAKADKNFAVAIGRGASAQQYNNAVAIGANSQANGATSLALGMGSKATGHDSYAIGYGSDAIGTTSIAFGRQSKASKDYDIVLGSEANTRNVGKGYSIAIGVGAVSGSNQAVKNLNGNDSGGVAIGTGAYTGVNKNNISLNSAVAVGAGAGAGYRKVDTDGFPTDNSTDADTNVEVLAKAFGGTTSTLDYFKNTGKADKDGFFSFQNVNINEATALGRNARAIGDQSVAIGAQSVAGQGSIVIGGNDIQAYDKKKYFKAANPTSGAATTVNDYDAETTPGTGKKNPKDTVLSELTITEKYKELVGAALDNSYRSSYGQDGSTVIGMQAHSTTPLGVAIGTNSIVRKGAFGATAIGSGASVFANAEAAVAIGMGSEAQGNYAVAAGTGAKAEESAVAAGYQANAGKSAVAVGDSSKAATSSVAVGQGAVSEQVSDIAIGQGAKAKGEQGAIAMGLGTIAQGHSSIMIGGSDISTAANQVVEYSREKVTKDGTPELYDGKITEVINGKTVTRTVKLVQTETVMGKKFSDAYREITGYYLNTLPLNYSSLDNKNGHASISMGIHSLSKGAMGVAIGTGARADALGSMALGTGAHASMQNSVAIGTGAVADEVSKGTRQTDISYDEDGNVVETGSAKAKYTFRWAGGINTSEGDVVSFGTPGAERQLKNVAAGRVAEDSTDAVNGSQLNAITRSLSQTITNGWQVGGNNKFRMSNIGSNDRVNFLDGLGTAVNIAEIHQAEDIDGHKLVKIGSDFYKASDFTDGKLNDGAQKVAAAAIKKQPAGANVTFDVKEVNSTLSVTPVGLKVTTGEVMANPDGTMKTPNNTSKANNATVTTAMNAAETALVASQKEWREKNDAYQQTESAYLAADTALTKGKEAVEAIQADIATTQQELKTAQDTLATDKVALTRAENEVKRNPNDTQKQSELNQAKEKVGGSQFVVDQRTQKLAHQQATLTERQNRVSVLEQEKTNAETVRNTAKGVYEDANNDLIEKKKEFDTAKEKFVAAGANQIATVQNVADSINASGWTLQQGTSDKDLVHPGDKVAFVDGNGTTVTVTTDAEGKRSEIKYSVNLGDGLEKTDDNKIKAKAGDGVTVGAGGIKVNTGKGLKIDTTDGKKVAVDADGTTITVDNNGKVTAVTGTIETVTNKNKATGEKVGQVRPAEADKGKLATVDAVASAVNSAKWMAKATNTDAEIADTDKTNDKTTAEDIAAGDEVTFTAGKNLRVKRDGKNFTFATDKNVSFDSVKVGAEDTAANGKKPVNLTTEVAMPADNNQTGKAPTTALNISSGTGKDAKPTQITGVGSVLNTTTVTSAPDGTAPANQPKLVNLGTAHNQTALADNVLNSAATVRDLANMGWKVSSDKVTGADDKSYNDVVRNADEVKFVGKNAAKVSGKTENGVRTITVDVEVPDVKTAKLVSSTDGSVIAPSTDSKLQDALKTAKDELAALPDTATEAEKEAAENKVKDAETALNKALDDKGVATAKNVADMINNSGFTLKTSAAADGKKDDKSTGSEVIKSGKTVEMVAGKNLTVKQEANGKVTYSLNPELINLTSAEFKADGKPTVKISSDGITITPAAPTTGGEQKPNVSLTENGLNNGGNAISNVAGNLDGAKTGTTAPTTSAIKPTALTETNAATVGDVLNSGWNIQEKGTAKDFVKAYDTVNFAQGDGTDVSVSVSDDKQTSTVKYSVKADGNSLEVGANGVKVKVSDGIKTTANGIAVKAADKTLTVGKDGVKVNTGAIAAANGGEDQTANRGKVTVTPKTKEDGTLETQVEAETRAASEIATVKNVADAINSAAWIAKVENTDDSVDTPTKNDKGTAVKAGDSLTLTAGKNLRVNHVGGNITFALAKDITVETANVENTLSIGKDGAKVNIAPTANGLTFSRPAATAGGAAQPVSITGVTSGLATYPQVGNKDTPQTGLVDLSKPATGTPTVGDNTAATVGDLRGMGWVLSADKETDNPAETYNAQVKNAEEVKFVGASGVTVSGKTEGNVRTITVGVDHQLATNNSVKPVEYTKKDGTKVYPKTVTNGGKTETKFYPNADGTGDEVPAGDVIVSVNGANGTTSPTTLSNVKSNLPETRNTADAGNPASKSQSAPTIGTADGNVNANNAATVGDILNSGWNLKGNGSAVDFVRAYDTVNFVNGKGTTVSIETDGKESRVKVDVDTADLTASNGKISAPDLKTLEDAVEKAKADAKANPADEAKKTALAKAEADLAKEQNKGVTAQNVAKAINESGFTLKTSATVEGKKDAASTGDEVINPGKTVEMVAGKNLTVKQDAGGKVTYATKDDVEFATVKIGKDEDGKKPVSLTTEKAVNASNNETGKEPATALKISSDGKPAQLVGVASVLNTSEVSTKPNGDKKADGKPAESKTEKLIDLAGTKAAPVNKNAAATVGDLQNMGWVVSTKDGNGYTDVVKNANKVDFKGGNGIEVRGSTAADGTRVITVSAKEGKVTNKVEITKNDGSKVHAVIIDGKYYERDENGKPKTDTEIPAADIKAADNGGSGFVTGNTVANAINKSGWNVGLAEKAKADAAFGDSKYALDAGKPEKVNPDDNVHFANGNNTVVKAATVEEVDKDGKTVTNTYIRVDAELPISQISAVDENGNKVVKDADGNWYPGKADGTADKTQPKVDPAKVRQSASMDPENKGDRYTPLAKRSDDAALTADQKDALSKQQDQYAKDAADKIAEQLKGQPQTVIEAAQKAAAEVARVEAKDKYLKDNGLDKGIGGTVITNVAWGQKPDDAVNVDQLQNSGWNLDSKAVAGSSGKVISGNVSPSKVKMDETVNIDAGNNIEITRNGKNIGIATSMTPQFSSVSLGTGADAPTLSVDGDALNVGSKKDNKPVRITNVAPGVKDGDVANVAQLKGVAQNLNNRIDNVDGNARAGIAQAIATAGLVQAYLPGKSMMAIGGGTYRGEAGYAIGYSSISDGGNWVIKGTASGNSRGHFGASASVGYQW